MNDADKEELELYMSVMFRTKTEHLIEQCLLLKFPQIKSFVVSLHNGDEEAKVSFIGLPKIKTEVEQYLKDLMRGTLKNIEIHDKL